MNSFIFSSLVYAVGFGGGVPTGYAIQGLMDGFNSFKLEYNAEDLRQNKAKFARDAVRKAKKTAELEQELIDSKNAVYSAEFYLNSSLKTFGK
jgi:hypothetical protein